MKKFVVAIIMVAIVLMAMLTLSACDGREDTHIHSFGEWNTTVTATCAINGERVRTCSGCDEKEIESINMLAHNLGEFVINAVPTCTTLGSKSKHCLVCDTKAEITEIEMLAHDLGEFVIDTAPTCTTLGSKSKHCNVCNTKAEVTEIAFDPANHVGERGEVVVTYATCVSGGSKNIVCLSCNEVLQRGVEIAIDSNNHLSTTTLTKESYCDEAGSQTVTCDDCMAQLSHDVIGINPNSHKVEGATRKVLKVSNCTESGSECYVCANCESEFGVADTAIDANNHDWNSVYSIDVKASCTTKGILSTHCKLNDNHRKDAHEYIDPHWYNWTDEYKLETNVSTNTFKHYKTCYDCGDKQMSDCTLTETIIPPTETKSGLRKLYCSVCKQERNIITQPSRNKDYLVTQNSELNFSLGNRYHSILPSGTLDETMDALEAHRASVEGENTDCTILFNDSKDNVFNIKGGECIVLNKGKYTVSGIIDGMATTSTEALIRVELGADVTIDEATISVSAGLAVSGGAIFVERGTLSIKNSTITGVAGRASAIAGIIMIKLGSTLNIHDGAVIKNLKNDEGAASFAISTPEVIYNNRDFATINVYGGLVEAQKDATIYGYNLIFNMTGGEIRNTATSGSTILEAVTLMGNSIANVTGGKLVAAKVGLYVCNDINKNLKTGGLAEHVVTNCDITAINKVKADGKGILNGVSVTA